MIGDIEMLFLGGFLLGILLVMMVMSRYYRKQILRLVDENKKKQEFYDVLIKWLKSKESNYHLEDYFCLNNYSKIAIYGMKELGELFFDELRKCDNISVEYAIDRITVVKYKDLPILSPDDCLPKVDVIVVTAIHYYNDIEDSLKEVVDCPIVSIEDVVYS